MTTFTFEDVQAAPSATTTPAASFSFEEASGLKAQPTGQTFSFEDATGQAPAQEDSPSPALGKLASFAEPAVEAFANLGKRVNNLGRSIASNTDKMAGNLLKTAVGNDPAFSGVKAVEGAVGLLGDVFGGLPTAILTSLGTEPLAKVVNPTLKEKFGVEMAPEPFGNLAGMAAGFSGNTRAMKAVTGATAEGTGFSKGLTEIDKFMLGTPEKPPTVAAPVRDVQVKTNAGLVEYTIAEDGSLIPKSQKPAKIVPIDKAPTLADRINNDLGIKTKAEQKIAAQEKLAEVTEAFKAEAKDMTSDLPPSAVDRSAKVVNELEQGLSELNAKAEIAAKQLDELLLTKAAVDDIAKAKQALDDAEVVAQGAHEQHAATAKLHDELPSLVDDLTAETKQAQIEQSAVAAVKGGYKTELDTLNSAADAAVTAEAELNAAHAAHNAKVAAGELKTNVDWDASLKTLAEAAKKADDALTAQQQAGTAFILKKQSMAAIKSGEGPAAKAGAEKAAHVKSRKITELENEVTNASQVALDAAKNAYNISRQLEQAAFSLKLAKSDLTKTKAKAALTKHGKEYDAAQKKLAEATNRASQLEKQLYDLKNPNGTPFMKASEVKGAPEALTDKGYFTHWTAKGRENFNKWFGESVVRDTFNRAKVMYHGNKKTEHWMAMHPNKEYVGVEAFHTGIKQPWIFVSEKAAFTKPYSQGAEAQGNTLPLFVRAVNPFDARIPAHVDELIRRLFTTNKENELNQIALHSHGGATEFRTRAAMREYLTNANSNWTTLETLTVQRALKAAGHDGFWTTENGVNNLAVYDPKQLKSALGNTGKFSLNTSKISGSANLNLLNALAGASVGFMSTPDNRLEGAMVGFAAGYWLSRGIGGGVGKGLEKQATKEGKLLLDELKQDSWLPDFRNLTANSLGKALDWSRFAAQADTTALFNHVRAGKKAGITEALDKKFRNLSEGGVESLTPREAELYNKYVKPMRETMADLLNQVKDPKEKEILAKDINTRLAKNHRAWWDSVIEGTRMEGSHGFGKTPSSSKGLVAMQLADGTVITQKHLGDGRYGVMAWNQGNATQIGIAEGRLAPGKLFNNQEIIKGTSQAIEAHTPIRYVQSELGTMAVKNAELRKYIREMKLRDDLLASPEGQRLFVKDAHGAGVPGMEQIGQVGLPGMGELWTTPAMREVLTDFKQKPDGLGNMAEAVNATIIRAMMFNPIIHLWNEIPHWLKARGATGLVTPMGIPGGASKGWLGLYQTMGDATYSVLTQDHFQRELAKHGQNLLYMNTRNMSAWGEILQTTMKDAWKSKDFKEIAKAAGMLPARLADRISENSALVMWGVRDIFVTQLVKEKMLMGYDMAGAVKEVERSMPMYTLPSRVLLPGKAGRVTSQLLQSPVISIFARYHYGMVNGLKEVAKQIASPLIPGAKNELVKGLDQLAFIVGGLTMLYPMLDSLYQKVLDNPDVKARRGGPFHPIHGVMDVAAGEKQWPQVFSSVWTPAPFLMGVEIPMNRQLFNGQPIVTPGAKTSTQLAEGTLYAANKLSPFSQAISIQEGRRTPQQVMLQQLDIIETTPDQKAKKEKIKHFLEHKANQRDKKMEKLYPSILGDK